MQDGWTSLMMACEEGHLDTVQLLVSKQCDINIGTKVCSICYSCLAFGIFAMS